MEKVFVYGTLRPGGTAAERMSGCTWSGSATVEGRLYRIDWYPGLVLGGETEVKGDVFLVPTERMNQLDAYEACRPCDAQPHEYKRVKGMVKSSDGTQQAVWIWEYRQPVDEERWIESGDWLAGFGTCQK